MLSYQSTDFLWIFYDADNKRNLSLNTLSGLEQDNWKHVVIEELIKLRDALNTEVK